MSQINTVLMKQSPEKIIQIRLTDLSLIYGGKLDEAIKRPSGIVGLHVTNLFETYGRDTVMRVYTAKAA